MFTMELKRFILKTEQVSTWIIHSDELYDSWENYLELLGSP
jgi:hypothetical protein